MATTRFAMLLERSSALLRTFKDKVVSSGIAQTLIVSSAGVTTVYTLHGVFFKDDVGVSVQKIVHQELAPLITDLEKTRKATEEIKIEVESNGKSIVAGNATLTQLLGVAKRCEKVLGRDVKMIGGDEKVVQAMGGGEKKL